MKKIFLLSYPTKILCFRYASLPVRIIGCDHRACAGDSKFLDESVKNNIFNRPYRPLFPRVDDRCERKIKECGVYGLEYLIAALLTRGAVVKDQLLVYVHRYSKILVNKLGSGNA